MALTNFVLKVVFLVALCFPLFLFQSFAEENKRNALDQEIELLEKFSTIYNLLYQYHVSALSKKELIQKAINGMTTDIDPYTYLMSGKELENLEQESMGRYQGVGITTQNIDHQVVVAQVYEGSPAALSGILPGDVITHIDGQSLVDISNEELYRITKSTVNNKIKISFFHPQNEKEKKTVTLRRDWLQIRSTKEFLLSRDLLVIQLHQFQKNTPDEVREIIGKFTGQTIILDLRNNPGGLLLAAVETAELFLSEGLIVETRDKNDRLIKRYISRKIKEVEVPELIVLINRYTASAAEILAGALQDRKRAVLFGERSFGKAVVQSVFPVSKDLFLKITTAKYLLPLGKEIHNIGIYPDYVVKDTIQVQRYNESDLIFQQVKFYVAQ